MKLINIAALASSLFVASPAFAQAQLPRVLNPDGQPVTSTGTVGVDTAGKALTLVGREIHGTFTATGQLSASTISLRGAYNASISCVAGTQGYSEILIERSYDSGTTWFQVHSMGCGYDGIATLYLYYDHGGREYFNGPSISVTFSEPEAGVIYRLRTGGWAATSVTYRISQ